MSGASGGDPREDAEDHDNHNNRDNPYPGLRPFQADEAHLFFGREEQATELLRRLQRSRFLAIVGTSGSGKSSLVRAGLLQGLYGGLMPGGSQWRVVDLRPGTQPLAHLAQALDAPGMLHEEGLAAEDSYTDATLRRSSLGLVQAVREARLLPGERVLVLVDQFEELFRGLEADRSGQRGNDATAFVNLLLESAHQSELPIYVALTMRSDFLGDCAAFRGLPEAISDGQYLIPRLTRDQQRQAITGPAAVRGVSLTPTLVNRLLNDVGGNPDQLPILQHALMRTWDLWSRQAQSGALIDLPDYERIGGMEEALSRHADEVLGSLGAGDLGERRRRMAEQLFKALVSTSAGGRQVRRLLPLQEAVDSIGAPLEELAAVVDAFRAPRNCFLMPPAHEALSAASVIDISHESLIRNWQTLRSWAADEAESARTYERVASTAALRAQGRAGLWGHPELGIALAWREQQRPTAAWARRYTGEFVQAMDFLDDSLAHAQAREDARSRRRRVRAVTVLLCLLGMLGLTLHWGAQGLHDFIVADRATQMALHDLQVVKRVAGADVAPGQRLPAEPPADLCSRYQQMLAGDAAVAHALGAGGEHRRRDSELVDGLAKLCDAQGDADKRAPIDRVVRLMAAGRWHRAHFEIEELRKLDWTQRDLQEPPRDDTAEPEPEPEPATAAEARSTPGPTEPSQQQWEEEWKAEQAWQSGMGGTLARLLTSLTGIQTPALRKERAELLRLCQRPASDCGRASDAAVQDAAQAGPNFRFEHPVHEAIASKLRQRPGGWPMNVGEELLLAEYAAIREGREQRATILEAHRGQRLSLHWAQRSQPEAASSSASSAGRAGLRETPVESYEVYSDMAKAAAAHDSGVSDALVEAAHSYGVFLVALLIWPLWWLWRTWQQRQQRPIAAQPFLLRRIGAGLIDLVVAIVLAFGIGYTAIQVLTLGSLYEAALADAAAVSLGVIAGAAYLLLGDALRLRHHRSFGKIAFHLRLVHDGPGGSSRTRAGISPAISARRHAPAVAVLLLMVLVIAAENYLGGNDTVVVVLAGLLVALISTAVAPNGRTWGDRLSGTHVIDSDSEESRRLDAPPRYVGTDAARLRA